MSFAFWHDAAGRSIVTKARRPCRSTCLTFCKRRAKPTQLLSLPYVVGGDCLAAAWLAGMPRARHLRRARRRVGPAGGRPEAQIPLKPTRGRGPLTFQGRTQTLTKRLLLPSERPPNTCQHLPKHLNLVENTWGSPELHTLFPYASQAPLIPGLRGPTWKIYLLEILALNLL